MKNRLKRFTPVQRIFHAVLMLSFIFMGATGLSRMYMNTPWGKWMGSLFGGYDASLAAHKYVGICMIIGFLIHFLYLISKIDWLNFPKSVIGPNSLLPRPKDMTDFFQHIGWFFGVKKLPEFDRWGYWEKFDYWAVFWGMAIIGVTGLMMAFPLFATRYMPGWGLNVAFWIHRIEAILAMAHVFIIHFFIAHLRRHHFPMDRAMFEGSSDLATIKSEKAAWLNRLKNNGELEGMLVAQAAPLRRVVFYCFGYAVVASGLFLLIGALVNFRFVLW
jgi:cytochrome b subunit of formate dehydrogenase